MLIRNYRPEDFPYVEALWKDTGIYTVERGDTPEVILRCIRAGSTFLILENPSDGSVGGTSWITFDGRRTFLHHFCIDPSLQGKGYGRKLALESLAIAREKNCPMKLEVNRQNIPALNLYKSLGFKVFEDYEVFINLDPGSACPSII